jgi:alginate O-acetyltransferase complex protein AlgI
MLFNSLVFIFGFLPIAVLGFAAIRRAFSPNAVRIWLLLVSLVFYGWWSVNYLILLLLWALANFIAGRRILLARTRDVRKTRLILAISISLNLALLAYFKYSTFILQNVAGLFGIDFFIGAIVLPLGISFHTFQQIAYLCDVFRGNAPRYTVFDYLLFVSFFPQLIAGPIVHHGELMPQFRDAARLKLTQYNLVYGIAFFTIGLFKKIVLADPLASIATPLFSPITLVSPNFFDAWIGTIAFGLGLYFDFSAYSDMAVGLARMFGIRLPYNFASPYQSTSIIEFWRRWHMTLSRWLRDYLYIPLGGSRRGYVRRYLNLTITMVLGGLWHGAAWTFVVWGLIHGVLLMINHAWNGITLRWKPKGRDLTLPNGVAQFLTLVSVFTAWVCFASANWSVAQFTLLGLFGINGFSTDGNLISFFHQQFTPKYVTLLLSSIGIALWAPNSQQILEGQMFDLADERKFPTLHFEPTIVQAAIVATIFAICVSNSGAPKEFVYFQF